MAGLIAGLTNGLTNKLANFSPKTRRPHTIVRTNGLVGAVGGLAGGIAIGLGIGFTFEVTSGIGIGLTNGVIIGFAVWFAVWFSISARIWGRYHLVVTWNAIRRKTPLRFGPFLDWAVQAGLLRESGISYQFRHRQLQDWLTSTGDGPRSGRRRPSSLLRDTFLP